MILFNFHRIVENIQGLSSDLLDEESNYLSPQSKKKLTQYINMELMESSSVSTTVKNYGSLQFLEYEASYLDIIFAKSPMRRRQQLKDRFG